MTFPIPGDLLVVDRSGTAQDGSLVVAAMALWAGLWQSQSLQVLRVQSHHGQLLPAMNWEPGKGLDVEIWGVVTTLIREVRAKKKHCRQRCRRGRCRACKRQWTTQRNRLSSIGR